MRRPVVASLIPRTLGRAQAELPALPVAAALAVMILWSAHDGGFDADTWYWGALVMLSLLVVSLITQGGVVARLPRPQRLALLAFALYVAWSYLSITWAGSPGDALTGSNRALLYLIVFTLFVVAPWTPRRALAILLIYAIGIGAVGAQTLVTMAGGHHVATLLGDGRLLSPTGYINSNAALFTSVTFVAIALAVRRDLPSLLRGVLVAIACEGIQLTLLAESRGWLFLLPFMIATAIAVVPARLRTAAAAILPVLGALAVLQPVLDVSRATVIADQPHSPLVRAGEHAARLSLVVCAAVLVIATLLSVLDARNLVPAPPPQRRRALGLITTMLAVAGFLAGGLLVTHGHPLPFIKRQLNGTTQKPTTQITHFAVGGTERYDIWRVSLKALKSNPVGGLGQDNFVDYYYRNRRSTDEPRWTHSFELRLLAHTGLVGFALMAAFLAAALAAATSSRRRSGAVRGGLAGLALLPLVVWLIHGSVDWLWEMPALAGPALGFLGMATALRCPEDAAAHRAPSRPRWPGVIRGPMACGAGAVALLAAILVLTFPYLSVRQVSTASNARAQNPGAALRDLSAAADLNPLNADPGRLGGTIALQTGRFTEARMRFDQATARDPGGWFAWLGSGLAATELGDISGARRDFSIAALINSRQPAVTEALRRISTPTPLAPANALKMLLAIQ